MNSLPRLHWFSPLPPAPSDIGHYTRRLLPHLARRAKVTLWTSAETWDRELEDFADLRSWRDEPWRALNEGDMAFYHLGNNAAMHWDIWRVSRGHPGVVVVHDLRLQHLFLGIYNDILQDPSAHRAAMARHYGPPGAAAAEDHRQGQRTALDLAVEFPLIDHAVDGALGAVVHVPMAFDHLEPLGLCPLLEQPLPYPPGPAPAPPPPLGSREPLRLIAFGYMGINRRLEGIFQAMATFDQPERLQLDLYGELYDPGAVADLVTHWQLDDRVTLHGFVPEAHLDAALAASHLALNLRYPSMGEASGSQLRIFDRARGSLVTRTGWYATLPLDAVGFVDPDPQREVMDLHRHWRQLLADPRALATMGAAGRRHLETHHCPEAYVDGLLALLPHAVRWRTGWAGRWLTRRAGEELAAWGLTRRALDMERLTSLCGGMWPEVGATSRGQRAVRGE